MLKQTSLLMLTLLLTACGPQAPAPINKPPVQQQPQPTQPSRVLGAVRLPVDTSSLGPQALPSGISARAVAQPGRSLTFVSRESVAVNTDSSGKYISITFKVRNDSPTVTFSNLNLYAYNNGQDGIAGTAITAITQFGGLADPSTVVQQALPTHGTSKSGGSVILDLKGQDFQAFSAAQAQTLQTDARTKNIIGAADTVLEYGYSVRKCAAGNCTNPTPGSLAPGEEGLVTFGIKVPGNNDIYRFQLTLLVTDESVRQETRGVFPPESLSVAQARATAAGATLVQVGAPDDGNAATTELANARISTTPAFLLEPQCASGTPATTQTIPQIQGTGLATIITGTQTVEGVVTAVFPGLKGYYIQDRFGDGNVNTSDGLYAYIADTNLVKVGDLVRATGEVRENFDQTQLGRAERRNAAGTIIVDTEISTSVVVCSTTPRALPNFSLVDLPLTNSQADLEKFEGMRVRLPEALTVTDNFSLDKFGELGLSSGGRLYIPTNGNGLGESVSGNPLRRIILDDGRDGSNLGSIPYLDSNKTRRVGDTVTGIEGVLGYGFNAYRVQPTTTPTFVNANPRSSTPAPVGGNLKVAAFNVLNYFTDFSGRGATNQLEFNRQKKKIVAALKAIDADVVGLIEVQNNGSTAVNDLLNVDTLATAGTGGEAALSLNSQYGTPNTYTFINDSSINLGTDVIKVTFIYKSGRMTPVGGPVADNAAIFDRPPVAQTFVPVGVADKFTAIVNHFKSKGSCPLSGDVDTGQGCWNQKRVQQSTQLLSFIGALKTSSADDDVLVIGDLNAYGAEDPIVTLTSETGGLKSLNTRIPAAERYSYGFGGQAGYLDHALASATLDPKVSGVTEWHINSDEPAAIDYDTNYDGTTNPKTQDLYSPDPFRSSDHDPVIVGLNLSGAAASCTVTGVTVTPNPASVTAGSTVQLSANVASTPANCATVAWGSNNTNTSVNSSGLVTGNTAGTSSSVTATVTGTGGSTASGSATVNVTAPAPSFTLSATAPAAVVTGTASTTTSALTVSRTNFTDPVDVTLSSVSPTADITLAGSPVSVSGSSATLTFNVGSNVAAGSYTLTLEGEGGGLTRTTTVTLTVNAVSSGAGVVISEFRFRGPLGGNDEFIELFNGSSSAVNIGGWKVQGRSGSTPFAFGDRATISANVTLQPGKFYLLTNSGASGYSFGVTGDQTYGTGIGDNQAIRLIDSSATIVDLVGFASTVCEGTCISSGATGNPAGQASYKRQPNAGSDTNQNATDFAFGATNANPQNSASAANGAN